MTERTTANSLFSLAPLRLTHRRLISRTPGTASRFRTVASTVPWPDGGAGSALLSVLDRALTDKEQYCREGSQVRRKGMEAERSVVEVIQVPVRRKKVVNATHQQSSSHARHAHVLLLLIPHHDTHKLFEVMPTVLLFD